MTSIRRWISVAWLLGVPPVAWQVGLSRSAELCERMAPTAVDACRRSWGADPLWETLGLAAVAWLAGLWVLTPAPDRRQLLDLASRHHVIELATVAWALGGVGVMFAFEGRRLIQVILWLIGLGMLVFALVVTNRQAARYIGWAALCWGLAGPALAMFVLSSGDTSGGAAMSVGLFLAPVWIVGLIWLLVLWARSPERHQKSGLPGGA